MRIPTVSLMALAVMLSASVARSQPNLVMLVSQPGDYVGQGLTYVTTNTANITAGFYYDDNTIDVQAFGFDCQFNANPLTVGVYTNAARYPFNDGSPGLSVYGNGRGCNTDCGSFQILELGTNADGSLGDLWLTFTQYCECYDAPMTGEIRYNSQLAPPAPAARTLRVPADYPTIQAAMNDASYLTADTILVSPGVYNESVSFLGKAANLVSLAGPAETFIQPPSGSSGVVFANNETTNSVLCGFTITNAVGADGVDISQASPTIISNTIANCSEGIYSLWGSAVIQNNTLTGSLSSGLYLDSGTSELVEGNILQNNGQNDGQANEPAIYLSDSTSPTVANNLIENNYSDGIAVDSYNNSSDGYPEANITQNIVVGNGGNGISVYVEWGDPGDVIINNTVVGNGGAGLNFSLYPAPSVLVMNNVVTGSPALTINSWDGPGTPLFLDNDFFSQDGNLYGGNIVTNLTGVDGNISADPWFACPPDSDYHLLAGSPCIDAGTNDAAALSATDFDGNPRILAGTTNGSAIVDLGAYEFNPLNPPVPCLYIDCQTDIVENAEFGQTSVVVSFPPPTATSVATVTCSPPSGSAFPGGTNVVTCTAVYGTNQETCSFNIIIFVPPAITNLPSSTNISAGQTLNLTVGVSGIPPLYYQWYFNQTAINGANGATLSLADVQAANEGLYHVVVANPAGSVTSSNTRVRVLPAPPVLSALPASLTVPTSTNLTLSVTATGTEAMTYQWLFNGNPMAGANRAQITLANVQSRNSGSYQVVVANAAGAARSTTLHLVVKASAPYFVVQPASTLVLAGSNTVLTSEATGSNPIKYQWFFNGRAMTKQTNPALDLTGVNLAATGQYYVVAENASGETKSSVAQLVVVQPPSLVRALVNQVVTAGTTATVAVSATGSSVLSYQWQFNGVPLAGTNATLVLTNLQPAASGFYQVTVANAFGSISATSRVAVVSPVSRVLAWGDNSYGQTTLPAKLTNIVAIAGGDFNTLALRTNGTLVAWGYQPTVPQSKVRFVAVACGAEHNLAIDENGTLTAWGNDDYGQTEVPAGLSNSVVAAAAGDAHSLALLGSGQVTAWGDDTYGQTTLPTPLVPYWTWFYDPTNGWYEILVPPTPVQAIAAGRNHNLVVLTNNTVVAWGDDTYGESDVPADLTNAVAVAGGYAHSVALCADGTVTAWGDDSYGQTDVPAGVTNVVAIAAGDFHTLALQANGLVVGWGDDSYGQLDAPVAATNAVAIAAGYYHSVALLPTAATPKLSAVKK
jgi:hypothetical protein